MNRASATTAALAACLVFWAGCASATTSVNELWLDSARPQAPLGKTLVVALLRDPKLAVKLEEEWASQLRGRGVDVTPIESLGPVVRPVGRDAVEALVRQHGFHTLLVSKVLDIKQVDRDPPASQVAVVETKLYDASKGAPFWYAQTDTFLAGASADDLKRPGNEIVRVFVETLIAEMAKAKLL